MNIAFTLFRAPIWALSSLGLLIFTYLGLGILFTVGAWTAGHWSIAALAIAGVVFAIAYLRARRRKPKSAADQSMRPGAAAIHATTVALIVTAFGLGGYFWFPVRRTAFFCISPIGKSAIPIYLRAAADEEVNHQAVRCLEKLGPDAKSALPTYITWLEDPKSPVQSRAEILIRALGQDAAPAIPAITRAIQTGLPAHVETLGAAGPDAVPALVMLLKDPSSQIRQKSMNVLKEMGPASAPAAPALVTILLNPNLPGEDRDYALAALKAIGPAGATAAEHLFPLAGSHSAGIRDQRRFAVLALAAIAKNDARTIPLLTGLLTDKVVADEAAKALGEIGPDAASAIPEVLKLSLDSDDDRWNAIRALGKMGPQGAPALARLLNSPDHPRKAGPALATLQEMGPAGKSVAAELKVAIATHPDQKYEIARILLAQGDTQSALDIARTAIETAPANKNFPYGVDQILRELGPAAKPITGLMIPFLDTASNQYEFERVINLLWAMDRNETVAYLNRTGKTPPLDKGELIEAMGQRGIDACIAALDTTANYSTASSRADDALRYLGPKARSAVPKILDLYDRGTITPGTTRGLLFAIDRWSWAHFEWFFFAGSIPTALILSIIIDRGYFKGKWHRPTRN